LFLGCESWEGIIDHNFKQLQGQAQRLSDFAGRFGFMVEAGLRFFSRAAALRLTFRPPWV
jgi:hypothetical protein